MNRGEFHTPYRITVTGRDGWQPPVPLTPWQRERRDGPLGKVATAVKGGSWTDVAVVLGFGVAFVAMVLL